MNKKQLIAMWLGISLIALTTLFPPKLKAKDEENAKLLRDLKACNMEYFSYDVKKIIRPTFLYSVDEINEKRLYGMMFLSHFIVAMMATGLIITFNNKKAR